MLTLSVIIPTFNRNDLLSATLQSLLNQSRKPDVVLVIDNSLCGNAETTVKDVVGTFFENKIKLLYKESPVNSGSIARDIGARVVKTDLVAFLDDDVQLDGDYYERVVDFFSLNDEALACQGYDKSCFGSFDKNNSNWKNYIIYLLERFFQTSTFFEHGKARVLPSLCVTTPSPNTKTSVTAEWVSTCAGVFKRTVFEEFEFENRFMKYSWNEYLDLSYQIFKRHPGSLFHLMDAFYTDAQTEAGRIPPRELYYMSEVYDYYLFKKHFDMNLLNVFIFLKCKVGRAFLRVAKLISRNQTSLTAVFHIFYASVYPFYLSVKYGEEDVTVFNKNLGK